MIVAEIFHVVLDPTQIRLQMSDVTFEAANGPAAGFDLALGRTLVGLALIDQFLVFTDFPFKGADA